MSNSKPQTSIRLDRGLIQQAEDFANAKHDGYTKSDALRDAVRDGLPRVVGPPWWAKIAASVARWAAMFALAGSMFALAGLASELQLFMTGFATIVAVVGGLVRAYAARRR